MVIGECKTRGCVQVSQTNEFCEVSEGIGFRE